MKLVFIIDNRRLLGGGEYAQFKFAEHLAKRGHHVRIFAVHRHEDLGRRFDITYRRELPLFVRGVGRINRFWDMVHTSLVVEPYLRGNKVDWIIGFLRDSAIKATRLGKKYEIPIANFVFENPQWLEGQLGERFSRTYKGRFKRSWDRTEQAYRQSDLLIPNSRLTQKECGQWLERELTEPVYPGVEEVAVREASEKHQIVYVGRLVDHKNVDVIIAALAGIAKAPKLVVVGSGPDKKALKAQATEGSVEVEFAGKVSDEEKWQIIAESRFMVFPSSFEGFGMPPAEALLCGKPCICSDIPIFREVYGPMVEYVPERDTAALRRAIEHLLSDPEYRRKRGAKGREYVASHYTWERSAQTIEALLSR